MIIKIFQFNIQIHCYVCLLYNYHKGGKTQWKEFGLQNQRPEFKIKIFLYNFSDLQFSHLEQGDKIRLERKQHLYTCRHMVGVPEMLIFMALIFNLDSLVVLII